MCDSALGAVREVWQKASYVMCLLRMYAARMQCKDHQCLMGQQAALT